MPSKNKKEWRQTCLEPSLKRFPEREEKFELSSGAVVDRCYMPEDIASSDYSTSLGYPGEYPFTRGIQPTMYRGRLWSMRQYSGFASAEESNKRYHYLLKEGQTGLSVAFDLPTQIGYDSDHPLSLGEVGKVGVPVNTLKDLEILFRDIPLDKVSTSMTINATASILLAMYVALAKKQGIDPSKLDGTIQNDVLKEYIARGTYIFPPKPSMRLIVDIFAYCSKNVPRFNTMSISGYHFREAGATAAQEIAFTFANGAAYIEAAIKAGLPVDSFAPRLSFIFNSQNNLFEEIAKFRAARRLWAKILTQRFGAKDPRSAMLRFHTQTSGSSLTAQQPMNNIVRATVQSLAAILGGTQSLATCSWDEALALPTEESVQLSLRTQQIIGYESGVADTSDPLGGSYFIESLTDDLEREITEFIKKIDGMGGAVAAIENGFPQKEIQDSSYRYQLEIEKGKRTVIGVNKFVSPYPAITGLVKVPAEETKRQIDRLEEVKRSRDRARVKACLARLEEVARGSENTMPVILECVETYASVGEICDVLRKVFGTQKELLVF